MAAKAAKTKLGFWLMTESRHALEIGRLAGFDVVILDMEHGAIGDEAADALIPFAKGLGLDVFSRVATGERVPIQKALDAGADGVIIPQIRDLAHARRVTAYAKYPPLGTRGLGFSRIDGYGRDAKGMIERENKRTLCLPMVETPSALADAPEIAGLATVDGLFLGPSDLSLTSGRGLPKLDAADFRDARRVARAAHGAGKPFTMAGASDKSRRFAVREGALFVGAYDELTAMVDGFARGARPLPKG